MSKVVFKKKKKGDKLWLGLSIGVILPIIGIFVVIWAFAMYQDVNFQFMYDWRFKKYKDIQVSVLTFAMIFNLIPFGIFNTLKMDQAVKGILYATILFVPIILYVKFF